MHGFNCNEKSHFLTWKPESKMCGRSKAKNSKVICESRTRGVVCAWLNIKAHYKAVVTDSERALSTKIDEFIKEYNRKSGKLHTLTNYFNFKTSVINQ